MLADTGLQLANFFVDSTVKFVTKPFLQLNALFEVVSGDYESVGAHVAALFNLFVEEAKNGAVKHVKFVGGLVGILYSMIVQLIGLLPGLEGLQDEMLRLSPTSG